MVEWLEKNYPLKFRDDPITGWRECAKRLRGQSDPHKTRSFMDETAELGSNESTGAVDQYIEGQIERARLERTFAKERE